MKSFTGFNRLSNATSHGWFAALFTILRLAIGLEFLMAGVKKIGGWSAEGFLKGAEGPFASLFQSLAGNPIVDQLNIWGLTLIGVALILGLMVRPASFFGIMLMALYYLAHFETNTANGFIDHHVILIIIFALFLTGGAGHAFGLDSIISRQIRRSKMITHVLFG